MIYKTEMYIYDPREGEEIRSLPKKRIKFRKPNQDYIYVPSLSFLNNFSNKSTQTNQHYQDMGISTDFSPSYPPSQPPKYPPSYSSKDFPSDLSFLKKMLKNRDC